MTGYKVFVKFNKKWDGPYHACPDSWRPIRPGTVLKDKVDDNRWDKCSFGINFYIDMKSAIEWVRTTGLKILKEYNTQYIIFKGETVPGAITINPFVYYQSTTKSKKWRTSAFKLLRKVTLKELRSELAK